MGAGISRIPKDLAGEIGELALRVLTPWGGDDQEHPAVQRLVDAFSALFEGGPRLEFTGSRLEAKAKELLFPDDENQRVLHLCPQRGLSGRESSQPLESGILLSSGLWKGRG